MAETETEQPITADRIAQQYQADLPTIAFAASIAEKTDDELR